MAITTPLLVAKVYTQVEKSSTYIFFVIVKLSHSPTSRRELNSEAR